MTTKQRKHTRRLFVGDVPVGGGSPVTVQTMTKTDTRDAKATLAQILRVAEVGADIVRCAVPDGEAAEALISILPSCPIPVIADIHFDYRLALQMARGGIHCLRLNPGNIGARWKIQEVVQLAFEKAIPIRIGVNAGSLEKDLLRKFGWPSPEAMVASAQRHIQLLEEEHFQDIKISLKASSVPPMLTAYRLIAQQCDYPLHLGVTEAGSSFMGTIKSVLGIGGLLEEGIGDTIRVSLTAEPEEEVRVGRGILQALELDQNAPTIISCPTCGRLEIDLQTLVKAVELETAHLREPIKLALMGCVVNGPGESAEADLGLAGGKEKAIIYKKGKVLRTVAAKDMVDAFLEELRLFIAERKNEEEKPCDD